ncbi:hypothetical protein INR49_002799, partial [Caranx melampygus]
RARCRVHRVYSDTADSSATPPDSHAPRLGPIASRPPEASLLAEAQLIIDGSHSCRCSCLYFESSSSAAAAAAAAAAAPCSTLLPPHAQLHGGALLPEKLELKPNLR